MNTHTSYSLFFKVDKSKLFNKKNKKPEPKVTSSEDEDEDEDDEMIWKMNAAYEPIDGAGGDSPYSTVPFLPKGNLCLLMYLYMLSKV